MIKRNTLNITKPIHYESEISFLKDAMHGLVVQKKYRNDVECIQWLNRYLSKYYDPSKGLPVAQHEFAALKLLTPFGIVPKPLRLEMGAIVMDFAGDPLTETLEISLVSYLEQCHFILQTFHKMNFKHNDLILGNVLVHKGKVKIIDFTLSEFNGVEIMKDLPNPNWARFGQDANLLSYFHERGNVKRKGLLRFFSRSGNRA